MVITALREHPARNDSVTTLMMRSLWAGGSARFEATKFWPWPSYLNETKSSCVKSSSAGRSPCCLTYAVLQAATNNFSSSNLLGEGSFGLVYKARLDYDAYAAVKRLTGAGQHSKKEFQVL